MSNAATTVSLPVRIQRNPSAKGGISIKSNGADFGWSTIQCEDAEHAREIMARYPSAAMPCWRNPNAVWEPLSRAGAPSGASTPPPGLRGEQLDLAHVQRQALDQ